MGTMNTLKSEAAKQTGENIRHWRTRRNMTQEELEAKSGVSHTTISNYENGKTSPSADQLHVLAKAMDIEPSLLVGELPIDEMTKEPRLPAYGYGSQHDSPFRPLPFIPHWNGGDDQREVGKWPVPRDLVSSDACVVMRVKDDSMRPFLMPGDAIIVDPEDVQPRSLATMVVSVNGEVVIRRFIIQRGRRFFVASHNNIAPIEVEPEHKLLARVVAAVERNLRDSLAFELGSPWRI